MLETAEMVAVRIEELGVVIITVYAQPSHKNTDLIIALGKLQAKIEADALKSVICGDFNAHNILKVVKCSWREIAGILREPQHDECGEKTDEGQEFLGSSAYAFCR